MASYPISTENRVGCVGCVGYPSKLFGACSSKILLVCPHATSVKPSSTSHAQSPHQLEWEQRISVDRYRGPPSQQRMQYTITGCHFASSNQDIMYISINRNIIRSMGLVCILVAVGDMISGA